jgi:hypothetical protein
MMGAVFEKRQPFFMDTVFTVFKMPSRGIPFKRYGEPLGDTVNL